MLPRQQGQPIIPSITGVELYNAIQYYDLNHTRFEIDSDLMKAVKAFYVKIVDTTENLSNSELLELIRIFEKDQAFFVSYKPFCLMIVKIYQVWSSFPEAVKALTEKPELMSKRLACLPLPLFSNPNKRDQLGRKIPIPATMLTNNLIVHPVSSHKIHLVNLAGQCVDSLEIKQDKYTYHALVPMANEQLAIIFKKHVLIYDFHTKKLTPHYFPLDLEKDKSLRIATAKTTKDFRNLIIEVQERHENNEFYYDKQVRYYLWILNPSENMSFQKRLKCCHQNHKDNFFNFTVSTLDQVIVDSTFFYKLTRKNKRSQLVFQFPEALKNKSSIDRLAFCGNNIYVSMHDGNLVLWKLKNSNLTELVRIADINKEIPYKLHNGFLIYCNKVNEVININLATIETVKITTLTPSRKNSILEVSPQGNLIISHTENVSIYLLNDLIRLLNDSFNSLQRHITLPLLKIINGYLGDVSAAENKLELPGLNRINENFAKKTNEVYYDLSLQAQIGGDEKADRQVSTLRFFAKSLASNSKTVRECVEGIRAAYPEAMSSPSRS